MSGVLNLGATLITSIWIILQACRTIEVRHWSLRHWSLRHLLVLTIARNVTLACHGNTLIADTCHSNNGQVWCHSQKEHTVDPVWRIWRCDITRLLQQITVTPASGNHSIAIVTIVLIQGMRKCHVTAITAIHVPCWLIRVTVWCHSTGEEHTWFNHPWRGATQITLRVWVGPACTTLFK